MGGTGGFNVLLSTLIGHLLVGALYVVAVLVDSENWAPSQTCTPTSAASVCKILFVLGEGPGSIPTVVFCFIIVVGMLMLTALALACALYVRARRTAGDQGEDEA